MKKKFLFKYVTNNSGYKLLALFIASLLWYFIQGKEVLEINKTLQVNFSVPKGYMMKGSPLRFKDVTIKGPRALLDYFTSRPLEATIEILKDWGTSISGKQEFCRGWNKRLSLIVHDPYVRITTDVKRTRTLPVKYITQGLQQRAIL